MKEYEVVIIGGGPAGLAAALAVKKAGVEDVIILERDSRLGGILNQCIHNGFGLHVFGKELTGPEYADRFIRLADEAGIAFMTDTMVIGMSPDKVLTIAGRKNGIDKIRAKSVILAMGCRERARGSMNIPGTRPAGIYSAGTAQRLMNVEGKMIGKEIVILGSGDIGLIMARRLTLEGAHVSRVVEIMPQPGGLSRNIVQCLDDYGIPLLLNHTVVQIHGKDRITGVTIAEVDGQRQPVPGTEEYCSCDTLLLSVGLIPENELSAEAGLSINRFSKGPNVSDDLETEIPGVFACGNVLHVHDLADNVSKEAEQAGKNAAAYVLGERKNTADNAGSCNTLNAAGVREEGTGHPARRPVNVDKPFPVKKEPASLRGDTMTCIGCPVGCLLTVDVDGDPEIKKYKQNPSLKPDSIHVSGNRCDKGREYAKSELLHPTRFLTSTVVITGGEVDRLPVRTETAVSKTDIPKVMTAIHTLKVKAPVATGTVLLEDCAGTGVRLIAAKTILENTLK